MSGTTTELGLATAVDSDDNADYLTINLANSLRTVDGLFNNITGHNHGGAHQGGAITPAAGSITSAMIADGTIATADLANASVTNAKLASDTARLNLLTNGGFEIWQRGNGPFTANGALTTDRWATGLAGTDTLSTSRDTTNQDISSNACAVCTFVLGTGAGSTGFYQTHSTVDLNLRSKTVTLSMRVKCSTANAIKVFLYADGGSGEVRSANNAGSGAYETLSVSLSVPIGATVVLAGVRFLASCTAYIDNAMLVVGSQAADYAPLHPADDLARCLRYYEIIGAGTNSFNFTGYQTTGIPIWTPIPYKAHKAVTPTVTKNGTWSVLNCPQPSFSGGDQDIVTFGSTAAALGAVSMNNSVDGCNITVEGNP